MPTNTSNKAILLLENGTYFEGKAAGKIGTTTGEICFNTGMTGYQEIFTDPSYFGQLLVATNVHIGNYGIKNSESESENVKISGLICRNFTSNFSRQQADQSIQDYFESQNLVAITDIDTRAIVKIIRDKGAMNGIISSEILDINQLKALLAKVPSMEGLELASAVSTKKIYEYGNPNSKYKVAVLDFGVKENILRCFADRNCYLKVFPAKTTINEMESWNPDGYFLSNGPGDPASMDYAIQTVRDILKLNKKIFGICLGHQLLGLGIGIGTYKLHHGHRGINHPVKNLISGKCEITSQNHGFGLDASNIDDFKEIVQVSHINLNDHTVEGIKLVNGNGFSVQYHPEAAPGPHDARYLFDEFIELLNQN
jgi:carbamoyl-phosphate synthase small subunit